MSPAASDPDGAAAVPAVTVVMAACNAQAYLAEALDSVLGQTLDDFELLLIDDASIDGTPDIVAAYARRDPRIRAIRLPHNAGVANARNLALNMARAPCVAICDDDDVQHPERLAAQLASLRAHPDWVMVGAHVRPFGEIAPHAPLAWLPLDGVLARPRILFQALFIDSASMFRRDLARIRGLRYPTGNVWEDWVFQALALQAGEIRVLPRILIDYRRHSAQQTSPRRLLAAGQRTRASMRRVLEIAGATCGCAELELHHAISPNPFGLVPDRAYLIDHRHDVVSRATAWLESLGRQVVRAGWTTDAAFEAVAAVILRHLHGMLAQVRTEAESRAT